MDMGKRKNKMGNTIGNGTNRMYRILLQINWYSNNCKTYSNNCKANVLHQQRINPTDGMPIKLRNHPDPKYKAKASKMPIPTAKSKAVETDDSCILSVTPTKGVPFVLSS